MQKQLNDLFVELQSQIARTYEQLDKDQFNSLDHRLELSFRFVEIYEQLYKIRVYARKVQGDG